ncbi:hypothetical protein FH123_02240 [Staphylococcus hominis]|nr:hypothetical protein [Staphylococcus hominis]
MAKKVDTTRQTVYRIRNYLEKFVFIQIRDYIALKMMCCKIRFIYNFLILQHI